MAKFVRLWGKKRGGRMSGWWVVGSVSEAAFFGLLFLLGIVTLTTVVTWRIFWPESSILKIGFGFWLMVIASASFIVIGLTAFLLQVSQSLGSRELRVARDEQAQLEHRRRANGDETTPSHLPRVSLLKDSPGVRLAFRLAPERKETGPLILAALFSAGWNALLSVLTVLAIQNHLSGRADYVLTVLLVPFGVVCFYATRWFFQLFRRQVAVGPTTLEISDLPLLPGKDYSLYLCQYGRVEFRKLQVCLVCFEESTYQQGTDVRTERCEVARQILIEPGEFSAEPEKPLELVCQFRLLNDTMHSFQSNHNAILWRVTVEGVTDRWPSFCRSFPVVVYPPDA